MHNILEIIIYLFIFSDWFLDIRDIAICIIPLSVMCLVMSCIAASMAFAGQYTTTRNRNRDIALIVVLFLSAVFFLVTGNIQYSQSCILLIVVNHINLFSASLCLVILCRFYLNSYRRDWMPMPERNSFGYSFWLETTTAVLLFVSFILTLFAGVCKILDIGNEKETAYAEDMMLGRR